MVMTKETKEVRECDRLQCRKRRGVAAVSVSIAQPDTEPEGGLAVLLEGDLCPYHYKQLVEKAKVMFGGKEA